MRYLPKFNDQSNTFDHKLTQSDRTFKFSRLEFESRGIPVYDEMQIVAFGNPLLDKTIYLENDDLLKKYNLEEDGIKEISKSVMKSINDDLIRYVQFMSPGGCAQNYLRIMQWLHHKKLKAIMYGSVGQDVEAGVLKKLLNDEGVETRYVTQKDHSTGKTIAFVTGHNRSLVAHIGAAEKLPLKDLVDESFRATVLASEFVYMEGFFITHRAETAQFIMQLCCLNSIVIAFNISAEYVCELFHDSMRYCVENSDIIFGNKREFEALRKVMRLDSVEDLADLLTEYGQDRLEQYGKIMVITDGPNKGTCVYRGNVFEFEVPPIPKEEVKDTTGAGDAFAAGFIAGLGRNKSLEECARIGCYTAGQIIRQRACSLPKFEPDILYT